MVAMSHPEELFSRLLRTPNGGKSKLSSFCLIGLLPPGSLSITPVSPSLSLFSSRNGRNASQYDKSRISLFPSLLSLVESDREGERDSSSLSSPFRHSAIRHMRQCDNPPIPSLLSPLLFRPFPISRLYPVMFTSAGTYLRRLHYFAILLSQFRR